MSNFTYLKQPFKVLDVPGGTAVFEVSTNGKLTANTVSIVSVNAARINATAITIGTSAVFADVTAVSVSVKVTSQGYMKVYDVAGTLYYLPAYTTTGL